MVEYLVSMVSEQLSSILQQQEQEVNLDVGVCEHLRTLAQTFATLQPVLQDAEEKQFLGISAENRQRGISSVNLWLKELKEISYDADDVLDELMNTKKTQTSQINHDDHTAPTLDNKVCFNFFFCCFKPTPVVGPDDIGRRIKDVRERLDLIAQDKDELNLIERQSCPEEPLLETCYFLDEPVIYGREEDKERILGMLLLGDGIGHRKTHVPVLSIFGMGGAGKTTLAQLVYNDKRVVDYFEKRIWVHVSDTSDPVRVAKMIIGGNASIGDDMYQCLCNFVKDKRFLLVLDDVWSDDPIMWDSLMLPLNCGAPGSRIVITTRSPMVATAMRSTCTHHLRLFSDDDSWSMFRRIAFRGRTQVEIANFTEIGKNIVKRCRGHIISVKIIASLMCFKSTEQDWRNVLENQVWNPSYRMDVVPALALSYSSLPSHLKQCFVYCAIFQHDEEINKDALVKLWMAQGFLGFDKTREPEIIGRHYFDNLATRSLLHDFSQDSDGNIVSCKMHDLVHDLAEFFARGECFITENNREFDASTVRHLGTANFDNSSIYQARNLRTMRLYKSGLIRTVPVELFHQFPYLRALDLASSCLEELPSEVERLLHLRYLDLSGTNLSLLPETVSNLHNLQCLRLNWCSYLSKLPQGIGRISNLRHLEIEGANRLRYLPHGIGRLSCLRTLTKLIVAGRDEGCNIGELKLLNHLEGSLEIMGLGQVANVIEADQAELNKKEKIRVLKFDFGHSGGSDQGRTEGVIERLQPHVNVKELEIVRYQGSEFPFWVSSNLLLCNLLTLELSQCKNCTELPPLGKLESLESLVIDALESVKYIGREFCGLVVDSSDGEIIPFPKLKKLKFSRMAEWGEWELPVLQDRVMPRLYDLTLYFCPKLRSLPALGKLESLKSLSINKLHSVKHVGLEFLGIPEGDAADADVDCTRRVGGRESAIFPSLMNLFFLDMKEWEDWDLPLQKYKYIMPRLCNLTLWSCPMLRALPALGKLTSLQGLKLISLERVQYPGLEFLGPFSDDDGGENQESASMTTFPESTCIDFSGMTEYEEQDAL